MRVVHRMRPRWLASVRARACGGGSSSSASGSRWSRWSPRSLVGLLLPGAATTSSTGTLNDFTGGTALIAVVVLLTTPLQAAGEEYVFRGYLLQAFGSLVRATGGWRSWSPPRCSRSRTALQNFPLFFDRFVFGLIAGWLVIRTGGLEAGIALHILNNFLAFGLALAFGDIGDDAERLGGQLVEHRADRHPVRRLHRARAAGGPADGSADAHPAARGEPPEPAHRGTADGRDA